MHVSFFGLMVIIWIVSVAIEEDKEDLKNEIKKEMEQTKGENK